MTNDEKIQRAEQLITEANALLNEVKSNSSNKEDIIAKYKNDYNKGRHYYLDWNNEVDWFATCTADKFEKWHNPYSTYLTEGLAEEAKVLKDFNDKLLAFKYCYDLDDKPERDDDTIKYYVYYDVCNSKYKVDGLSSMWEPLVYFSTKEIAQKCANWLNSLSE